MRDINALKRTKTFIEKEVYNSIRVPKNKLSLYCYADIFKDQISHVPYYFGNNDIMIDFEAFKHIEDSFVRKSLSKYPFFDKEPTDSNLLKSDSCNINLYFRKLLGDHYVDKKN